MDQMKRLMRHGQEQQLVSYVFEIVCLSLQLLWCYQYLFGCISINQVLCNVMRANLCLRKSTTGQQCLPLYSPHG